MNMKSEGTSDNDLEAQNSVPNESLDQIREILFGNQTRDIDGRFQEVSDRLSEAIGGLRSLVNERTDAISQKLEQQVHHLKDEIGNIRRDSSKKASELDSNLSNTANDLRQQIGALSETLSVAERSLRGDVENGLGEMKAHLTTQLDAVRDHMQQEISKLSASTVARRSFSEALKELSIRFEDD